MITCTALRWGAPGQPLTPAIDLKLEKGSLTGMAFLGGDNINELLLLKGQAWVDRTQCTADICAKWIKMEEAAKATQKGLWSDPQAMPPWEFRAQNAPKPAAKKPAKKQ